MTSATPKPRAGEHTKGPWRAQSGVTGARAAALVWLDGHALSEHIRSDGVVLGGNSHQLVAIVPHGEGDAAADARRIVACVNACEGISTETLESGNTIQRALMGGLQAGLDCDALITQLETCKAAHMSNCLDADKLRTRIAELREVLEHVCDTISGPAPALRRAREILAKHGR